MNCLRAEKRIFVTKVGQVQSLKMTTLSPVATLDNVKNLLNLVLAEADRIKGPIQAGTYVTAID